MSAEKFPIWISHSIHVRTFTISGKVTLKEPLRVGAGRGEGLSSLSDLPVLKLKVRDAELPVIPGSSWKGVLRSHVETLLRLLNHGVCGGVPGDTCAERGHPSPLERMDRLLRRPSEQSRREVLSMIWREYCLACKMFGAPSYMANVAVDDSYPLESGDGSYLYSLGVKPGIAIDRRSGAVRRGAFYQVEFVEPGSVFSFRLTARNLPNYLLGLLAWALLDLSEGMVRIGGFKSRGFGRVELSDLTHFVTPRAFDREEGGQRALKGFTDDQKPWYDPADRDVSYNGSTLDLLESLKDLAIDRLGGVRVGVEG